jgi:hypothetical protein
LNRYADELNQEAQDILDFHVCGFSPRFSRAGGSRGTNHRLQAPCSLGGGLIRRKAFQAGVYPPPAQPTGFSRSVIEFSAPNVTVCWRFTIWPSRWMETMPTLA